MAKCHRSSIFEQTRMCTGDSSRIQRISWSSNHAFDRYAASQAEEEMMNVVLSVKWRRGESAPSGTQPIRDAVVVATADRATTSDGTTVVHYLML